MSRVRTVFALALLGPALVPATGRAQTSLRIGKKFEGQVNQPRVQLSNVLGQVPPGWSGFNGGFNAFAFGYVATVPLRLKAGEAVSISATVTGADRKVQLILLDPSKTGVAFTQMAAKKTLLKSEEVNATGTYLVVVASDRIGPYQLLATKDDDKEDEESIDDKIARLEKELGDLKRKRDSAKGKGSLKTRD
jgi:hypothetical protein